MMRFWPSGTNNISTIYWITGAIGSGKTTLGSALASSFPKTLFIDGDFFIENSDALPFEQRIQMIKDSLIKLCYDLSNQKKSAVIAYPIEEKTVCDLRETLSKQKVRFIVIGVEAPNQGTITRRYSDWEKKRQKEMFSLSGNGYVDIIVKHPTPYLYDSLIYLKKEISKLL